MMHDSTQPFISSLHHVLQGPKPRKIIFLVWVEFYTYLLAESVPSIEKGQSPKRCDSLKGNQGANSKRRKNECLTTKTQLASTTVFPWKISILEKYFKELNSVVTNEKDETLENFYLSVDQSWNSNTRHLDTCCQILYPPCILPTYFW